VRLIIQLQSGLQRAENAIRDTIAAMAVIQFLMQALEFMFFLGLAGSTIVVLISFFEDGKELFGED
jgi:hypothetical protein